MHKNVLKITKEIVNTGYFRGLKLGVRCREGDFIFIL